MIRAAAQFVPNLSIVTILLIVWGALCALCALSLTSSQMQLFCFASALMTIAFLLHTALTKTSPNCITGKCSSLSRTFARDLKTTRATMSAAQTDSSQARNVLGGPLQLCCLSPKTGFYRNGFCTTGPDDLGVHTVCARVTDEFLQFSKSRGNDLTLAAPQYGFPGLKEGDGWCLCASRWLEAAQAGKACPIVLASTHEKTLQVVPLEILTQYAVDRDSVQS